LAEFPEGISHLTGFTQLSLDYCTCLAALPEGISQLTGLTQLKFKYSVRWAEVPECISIALSDLICKIATTSKAYHWLVLV
jgi:hypothetical protein